MTRRQKKEQLVDRLVGGTICLIVGAPFLGMFAWGMMMYLVLGG